jgi:hypothetical protein
MIAVLLLLLSVLLPLRKVGMFLVIINDRDGAHES